MTVLRYRGVVKVQADVMGYATPSRVVWQGTNEGHVPDVMGGPYIIEVETASSLNLEHTRSQCALFGAYARRYGLTFVVIVPIGYKNQMESQLASWRIPATVWEL